MSDVYDSICEVRIQTEGFQGGYVVKIVDEDDTTTYHLEKHELVDLVKKIQETAVAKGEVSSLWRKVG